MTKKKSAFILIIHLFLIIFMFMLGSCSSHKKNVETTPSQPSSPAEGLEAPASQTKTPPEEKPIVPPDEQLLDEVQSLEQEKNEELGKEDFSTTLEEALSAYQNALISWEQGDLDTALAALDEAYGLILKADLPPDSPFIQGKNDLRLLIAQRIQEVYASRLTPVGDNHNTIPLVENKYVLKEIQSFQTVERKSFEEAYRRAGLYREMILDELKNAGLPEDLSWLPVIESWFKVRALSRARALGLWQFIASTGYRFGLKQDRWVDERMDPLKATRAAVKYLSNLHSYFGDWTTALAAYNCGEIRVQNVIKTQQIKYLDNFWDLFTQLPFETARFVPRFIGALLIIKNPEKYDFPLPEAYSPLKYESVTINHPAKLSSLSTALGLDASELALLNPELRFDATPEYEYPLKVPVGYTEKTLMALGSLPRWIPPEATYTIHYVRKGESLSVIASRYRTSVAAIARLNGLRRPYLIRPRQRLKIPGRGASVAATTPKTQPRPIPPGEKITHTVKKGDTLFDLAKTYGTTVEQIKKDNNLRSNNLSIGQKLVLQSAKPEGVQSYTVNPGDTPIGIATKFGMGLDEFLSLNGLTTRSKIYPGQELLVGKKE